MGGGQQSKAFHFFGDVWFEDPRQFLDEDDFAILQQYMPMTRALDMGWRHSMFLRVYTPYHDP
jgi:hypothetical protein